MRNLYQKLVGVFCTLSLFLSGCTAAGTSAGSAPSASSAVPSASAPVSSSSAQASAAIALESTDGAGFEAVMLDVHQGLSILIQADGHTMLFDGGPRSRSSYVVAWLKQHN
ncbi:MAG: hypothetical protein PUA95_07640, partial [Lactimicrobium massiliense]|nr:hypothetical protein [Lactimicrobium massiliense]